jgi:hypothetical protein
MCIIKIVLIVQHAIEKCVGFQWLVEGRFHSLFSFILHLIKHFYVISITLYVTSFQIYQHLEFF